MGRLRRCHRSQREAGMQTYQNNKASHLDGLSAQSVESDNRDPVARNSTRQDNDEIANGNIVKILISASDASSRVSDDTQNSSIV